MISCLCVTRGDRPALLAKAVADFCRQSFSDRELLILHDGDGHAVARIASIVAGQGCPAPIRVERVAPGPKLGGLRNIAVARAAGDWICQWDDDDRYHPERLSLQWRHAQSTGSAVNYLSDQLHWFPAERLLFWDDWEREIYPLNLIQGTILARRDILPPYPDLSRGEDTAHTHALLSRAAQEGFRISRLRKVGWCHVYTCHGANVWDLAHHGAISRAKHLSTAALLPRLAELKARLPEYVPPLGAMHIPLGQELVTLPG